MKQDIDRIWVFSKFYGDLLFTAKKLNQDGESYAAFLLLFNVLELICKSLRESDNGNLMTDIEWLANNGLITADEMEFLSGSEGIRKVRNIMTHRNPYAYFYQIEGVVYSFADKETWDYLYELFAPRTIKILRNAIDRSLSI